MKYILHIDTATDTGTVAIACDGHILATRTNTESRNHAGSINAMIGEVLTDAKCDINNIDAIAVCGGPGSYTGLRIGMATAKGLCYVMDKPLIADNRLTLLAYKAWLQNRDKEAQYLSLITAREKEYFISIYDKDFNCILAPQHVLEVQLGDFIKSKENTHIITDASEIVFNSLNINVLQIASDISTDLSSWALYALEQYKCNNTVNLASAEPFYLKQVYTHK